MHHEQLGLGTVLPRAQACDGVGPAVELPGLGHVVDADDEGQAAREECVSQLRVKDQVVAASARHSPRQGRDSSQENFFETVV